MEIFAGLAESYELALDLATMYQDRRWKDWVARRLGADAKGLVLDVGCGTLVLEERMARLGTRFVGLDLSPQMVRVARAKSASNVTLLTNADAESLPFPDGTFDSVVSCYVPKYVDPAGFVRELARVMRPGADVLLYDFAKPRGPAAPFLQMYIQGGLRAMALVLGLARRTEATTFRELPKIIQETRWDEVIPRAMERGGFEKIEAERLTGGVVFAYWGRRKGDDISGADFRRHA